MIGRAISWPMGWAMGWFMGRSGCMGISMGWDMPSSNGSWNSPGCSKFFGDAKRCLLRIRYKSSFVKGLAKMSSMPFCKYVTKSLSWMFPVMAMIGVLVSNRRMMLVAVAPSKLGMTMSINTKSYFVCSTVEMAFSPSVTTVTWHPYFIKNLRQSWMHTLSSSTSNTWNLGVLPSTGSNSTGADGVDVWAPP